MLNIKQVQSKNECYISGILNELEIVEGKTHDGRDYVRGIAKVRVDQEVNGKLQENIIPISMFSMKLKGDNTINKVYTRILGYKENLISVAAAEDISQASKVTIAGKTCNIEENLWFDQRTNVVRSNFQIAGNFINAKRDNDKEEARFELSGVVLGMRPEINSQEEETGRLIVNFGVIGYNGRIDVIDLIAEDAAKTHIEANWMKGDTVSLVGIISMTQKTVSWMEEQGFGEPIERTRTESRRELIIKGGSAGGLEESLSYDADDVKAALAERKGRMEEKKKTTKPAVKASNSDGFGF